MCKIANSAFVLGGITVNMSENIEIRPIITNANTNNVNSVSDTPVTDPASGAKVSFVENIKQKKPRYS